jgi:anti-sigma regulatory factor (Ser/Thr protein kinase)
MISVSSLADLLDCHAGRLAFNPGSAQPGLARNQMETMAPIRSAVHPTRHIALSAGPAAAGAARSQVRAAIRTWDVPVDAAVAVLLTSELVTNAIRHGAGETGAGETGAGETGAGETVRLVITCRARRLRVDVHDTSSAMPVPADAPADADAEAGRGLLLVDSLSADWGCYQTLVGKAVYFTLAFEADLD